MRAVEKAVDHVLAAAQLEAVEKEIPEGQVSGDFVAAALAKPCDEGARPPSGMYL